MLRIFDDWGRGCKAPGLPADSCLCPGFPNVSISRHNLVHLVYEYLFMPHPWRFSAALIWLALISFHGATLAEPVPSPKVVFVIVDGIPADVIERVPTPGD
jgi:hypothetical protein